MFQRILNDWPNTWKIPMLLLDISEAHKEAEEKKARELEEKLEQKRQEVQLGHGHVPMESWTTSIAGLKGSLKATESCTTGKEEGDAWAGVCKTPILTKPIWISSQEQSTCKKIWKMSIPSGNQPWLEMFSMIFPALNPHQRQVSEEGSPDQDESSRPLAFLYCITWPPYSIILSCIYTKMCMQYTYKNIQYICIIFIYIYVWTHTHIYIYIYIHTHTYIRTYIDR